MEARPVTAIGLLFLPIVILNVLRYSISPIDGMFSYSNRLTIFANGFALLIGGLLYQRTKRVRDYEWQRSKALKSTKKQLKAEESGVWSKDVTFASKSQPLSEELLSRTVGDINQEPDEIELDRDEKKEVNLLLDSTLVMNATSKMYDSATGDVQVDSTIGAQRKSSFMDNMIDKVGSLFGKNVKEKREQKHQNLLQKQASENPTSMTVFEKAPTLPEKEGLSADADLEMMSISDHGNLIQSISPQDGKTSTPTTLEEMASMSSMTAQNNFQARCRSCQKGYDGQPRYCPHCGVTLST
tara:strand:+ start:5052 stop:5945 length:894 start_codon:yes stop_codon:yes gene_type:complete